MAYGEQPACDAKSGAIDRAQRSMSLNFLFVIIH